MTSIFPTHTCFTDALALLVERARRDPALAKKRRLLLVHGVLLIPEGHPEGGEPYAHAWVLQAGQCWFTGILDGARIRYAVPRDLYYHGARLQEFTAYTVRQALYENHRSNHYGPWIPRYRDLCAPKGMSRQLYSHGVRVSQVERE